MEKKGVRLGLFPLPVRIGKTETDGCFVRRTAVCSECEHRECATGRIDEIRLCSEGVNYLRVDDSAVIHGIVVNDWTPPAHYSAHLRKKYKRHRRDNPAAAVDLALLQSFVRGLRQCLREQVDVAERATVDSLRAQYAERNFEDWAREEIRRATQGLSAALIHDQLQYLATIYQNADFVLSQRYGDTQKALQSEFPGVRHLSEVLQRQIWQKEKAILVTCELLSERQKAARLLVDDGSVFSEEWSPRRPHQIFTKLMRLYDTKMTERGVKVSIDANWVKCTVPGELAMVAALAIFDNAVKYAPERSMVWIKFEESEQAVVAIVDSLGPRIDPSEQQMLGTISFRGRHATARGVAGSGIGLWQARLAVRDWGALDIRQEPTESSTFRGYYRTQAALTFLRNPSRDRVSARSIAPSARPPDVSRR